MERLVGREILLFVVQPGQPGARREQVDQARPAPARGPDRKGTVPSGETGTTAARGSPAIVSPAGRAVARQRPGSASSPNQIVASLHSPSRLTSSISAAGNFPPKFAAGLALIAPPRNSLGEPRQKLKSRASRLQPQRSSPARSNSACVACAACRTAIGIDVQQAAAILERFDVGAEGDHPVGDAVRLGVVPRAQAGRRIAVDGDHVAMVGQHDRVAADAAAVIPNGAVKTSGLVPRDRLRRCFAPIRRGRTTSATRARIWPLPAREARPGSSARGRRRPEIRPAAAAAAQARCPAIRRSGRKSRAWRADAGARRPARRSPGRLVGRRNAVSRFRRPIDSDSPSAQQAGSVQRKPRGDPAATEAADWQLDRELQTHPGPNRVDVRHAHSGRLSQP